VMDSLLELRNVIWEPTMLMLPTSVNLPANSQDVEMDMLILMRNVIQLLQDPALPHAEAIVFSHTVVMELLMLQEEKSVTLDLAETTISQQLDALLDAHKTLVEPSDPPQLEILTEPWPAQDVSTHMLVQPPDLHAPDLFNGWLPNLFKRSLNYKMTNSKMSSELELEEVNEETANSLILSPSELVIVSLPPEELLLLPEVLALLSPENLLFKQHSIFSAEIPLPPQSFNKPLQPLFLY